MDCELDFAQKSFNVFVLDSSDIVWNDGMKEFGSKPPSLVRGSAVRARLDRPKINVKYPIRILVSGPKFEPPTSTNLEPYQYINLLSYSP